MSDDSSKVPMDRINQINEALADINQTLTENITLINNKLILIDSSISALSNRLTAAETSISSLTASMTAAETDINALETTSSSLITRTTNLETRATDLEARRYVKTSYRSGTTWYRRYSDGWVEQGGQSTMNEVSAPLITLTLTMANTNYFCGITQTTVGTASDSEMGVGVAPYSTRQIQAFCHYINPNTTTIKWIVIGQGI